MKSTSTSPRGTRPTSPVATVASLTGSPPSKNTFPGDRKDRNAAHSRVYRLLKKNHTEALADEVATLHSEVDAMMAAYALSSVALSDAAAGIGRQYTAQLDSGATVECQPAEPRKHEPQDGVEITRKERKAMAAKAARKRARERLAGLEQQVAVLRQWVVDLRALSETRDAAGADDRHSEADSTSTSSTQHDLQDAPAVPPKKRHRVLAVGMPGIVIEDVD